MTVSKTSQAVADDYKLGYNQLMSNLTLSLFGPFEGAIEQHAITDFPTDKIRALLAYLAIETDKPHRRAAIATLFWPEYTDGVALRNLRQSLHRLRQTLDGADGALSDRLLTVTRQTITLNSAAITLDTAQFERQLAAVAAHKHGALHECEPCLAALQQTVSLYQGEFLDGFLLADAIAFSEWQTVRREQFQHQATDALQQLVHAHEARRDYRAMHHAAAHLLRLEPWREEAHRWAMCALALAGQRSDALAQYERCCTVLSAELGVEPTATTTDLYEQIRRNDISLSDLQPSTPTQEPQTATNIQSTAPARAPLLRFPQEHAKFLGRATELAQLTAYFREEGCRLVTLIGPGGSGKTRLAMEAVSHHLLHLPIFADGIIFVPLASVTDPALLTSTIATAVGLHLQEQRSHQAQLVDFLRDKQLLLLLDNVEQIVDCATTLAELLDACPTLALLVTSRVALNLRWEQRLTVGGLPYAAADATANGTVSDQGAVQLFVQAARQVQPHFDPSGDTLTAILQICELVQGMPLALELAATWVRLTDCAMIAQEIRNNLDFLATPAKDMPARHRSMSAVFAHSWQLIADAERRLLAQLSIFAGGFTLEAMMAVTGGTVVDLANLLDWSLIQRVDGQRYGLHELLRQFAAAKLVEWEELDLSSIAPGSNLLTSDSTPSPGIPRGTFPASEEGGAPSPNLRPMLTGVRNELGLQQETQQRHSDYFLSLVAEQGVLLQSAQPQAALRNLRRELDNIRSAWRWAVAHQRLAAVDGAAAGFADFLFLEGLLQEGEHYFATAAATSEALQVTGQATDNNSVQPATCSRLLVHQAEFLSHQGKLVEAQQLLSKALSAALQSDDVGCQARAHAALGHLLQIKGEYHDALTQLQQALTLYTELGQVRGQAQVLNSIGQLHWGQSQYDEALLQHQRALALDRQLEHQLGIAQHLSSMGLVYYRQGHYEQARECHEQALAVAKALDNPHNMAKHLNHIGVTYQDQSRFAEATACFEEALALDRTLGNRLGIAARQTNLGLVYMRTGDQARALACTEEAHQLTKIMDHKAGIALTTGNLGVIYWRMGDYDRALALHHEALALDEALGNQEAVGRHLANMGDMCREQEKLPEALTYLERSVTVARAVKTRYQLAESLYRKAETLLALGRLDDAARCQQESLAIAEAIGRVDTRFGCQLLAAKLHHARGEYEATEKQLRKLLQQTESERDRAAVHYEWWRLLGESFHAEKARTLYERLLQETPNAIYRRRLAMLTA